MRVFLSAALLMTSIVLSTAAWAEIEEIIVTAQKREQGINEVPLAISAFSAQAIADYGIRSAEDLSSIAPGLVVNQSGGTGTLAWSIRGVGFNDYSTSAASTVGIYVDEVSLPYPVMASGQYFDVDRIEVVKGPQGDLYGRNTTAGQVLFVSNKPTEVFEAGGSLSYGNYQTLDVEGYVSGPLSDGLRGRAAFKSVRAWKGWQESLSRPGDTLGEKEAYALRGQIEWDTTADLNMLLSVRYNHDRSDGIANAPVNGLTIGLPSPTTRATTNSMGQLERFVIYSTNDNKAADWTNGPNNALRPGRDNQLLGVSAKVTWNIGDIELVSISAYDQFDRTEANDWDGVALLDSSNINVTDIEVFSQEIRASSTFGDAAQWLVGLYYSTDDLAEDYNYFFGEGRFGINQLDTNYTQDVESVAAFAHVEWDVTERWGLNVGARYTSEDREWSGCTNDATPTDVTPVAGRPLHDFLNNFINGPGMITPNGLLNDGFNFPNDLPPVTPLEPNGCGTFNDLTDTPNAGQYAQFSRKISANEWMWKVGVDYSPIDDVLMFVNVSRGFKSGGFNGANANTHSQLLPYEPETLTAWETGFKATLVEGRIQWNASVFYYDYKNKQERNDAVTPVGNISGLTNVPKSEVFGVEAELNASLIQDFNLTIGVVYLDTEIKEYMAVDGVRSRFPNTVLFDASGLELDNAPRWSLNLGASYDFLLAGHYILTPSMDAIYRDKTSGGVSLGEAAKHSYVLANARLSLSSNKNDKWRATLWVRNLFDRDYFLSALGGGNFTFVRTNGMPRTYGIALDYRF